MKVFIEQSLDTDKAQDIISFSLNHSALADHMIIASGTSSKHVNALAQNIKERLEKRGIKNIKMEGMSQSDWVVIDIGDIIVHIFRPEVRNFYNIEKMWSLHSPLDVADQQIQA